MGILSWLTDWFSPPSSIRHEFSADKFPSVFTRKFIFRKGISGQNTVDGILNGRAEQQGEQLLERLTDSLASMKRYRKDLLEVDLESLSLNGIQEILSPLLRDAPKTLKPDQQVRLQNLLLTGAQALELSEAEGQVKKLKAKIKRLESLRKKQKDIIDTAIRAQKEVAATSKAEIESRQEAVKNLSAFEKESGTKGFDLTEQRTAAQKLKSEFENKRAEIESKIGEVNLKLAELETKEKECHKKEYIEEEQRLETKIAEKQAILAKTQKEIVEGVKLLEAIFPSIKFIPENLQGILTAGLTIKWNELKQVVKNLKETLKSKADESSSAPVSRFIDMLAVDSEVIKAPAVDIAIFERFCSGYEYLKNTVLQRLKKSSTKSESLSDEKCLELFFDKKVVRDMEDLRLFAEGKSVARFTTKGGIKTQLATVANVEECLDFLCGSLQKREEKGEEKSLVVACGEESETQEQRWRSKKAQLDALQRQVDEQSKELIGSRDQLSRRRQEHEQLKRQISEQRAMKEKLTENQCLYVEKCKEAEKHLAQLNADLSSLSKQQAEVQQKIIEARRIIVQQMPLPKKAQEKINQARGKLEETSLAIIRSKSRIVEREADVVAVRRIQLSSMLSSWIDNICGVYLSIMEETMESAIRIQGLARLMDGSGAAVPIADIEMNKLARKLKVDMLRLACAFNSASEFDEFQTKIGERINGYISALQKSSIITLGGKRIECKNIHEMQKDAGMVERLLSEISGGRWGRSEQQTHNSRALVGTVKSKVAEIFAEIAEKVSEQDRLTSKVSGQALKKVIQAEGIKAKVRATAEVEARKAREKQVEQAEIAKARAASPVASLASPRVPSLFSKPAAAASVAMEAATATTTVTAPLVAVAAQLPAAAQIAALTSTTSIERVSIPPTQVQLKSGAPVVGAAKTLKSEEQKPKIGRVLFRPRTSENLVQSLLIASSSTPLSLMSAGRAGVPGSTVQVTTRKTQQRARDLESLRTKLEGAAKNNCSASAQVQKAKPIVPALNLTGMPDESGRSSVDSTASVESLESLSSPRFSM